MTSRESKGSPIGSGYCKARVSRSTGTGPARFLRAALSRAAGRLPDEARRDAMAVLAELDTLGNAAEDPTPPHVPHARFLSLWQRIGAILRAVSPEK